MTKIVYISKIHIWKCLSSTLIWRSNVTLFSYEYTNLLNLLRARSNFVYICDDYNIDILKMCSNNAHNTFYENVISCGFAPKTLPTRTCDTASTLIDNVYTNVLDKSHISGILIRPISDHQMAGVTKTLLCTHGRVSGPNSLLDHEVIAPCGYSVPCQILTSGPETWPWGPVGWGRSLHDRVSRVPACKPSLRAKLESDRY